MRNLAHHLVAVPDGDGVNEHGSENEANLFGQPVPIKAARIKLSAGHAA